MGVIGRCVAVRGCRIRGRENRLRLKLCGVVGGRCFVFCFGAVKGRGGREVRQKTVKFNYFQKTTYLSQNVMCEMLL